MNGCIIEGTPIIVDLWMRPDSYKIFFLTHLHADHMKNLTSSWRYPFYTSPLNRLLLQDKFKFADHIVIPLELDEPHIIPADAKRKRTITVTLINANHVPGSVMFLFQGQFGNILYCGDMRFYPELFQHPILAEAIPGGIDRLYLDNTFAKKNYNFPTRKEAAKKVFRIIDQCPNHEIKLGIRKLGKEDILESVAQKYQELIYVSAEKFDQLKILRRPNVYTTDCSQSRIHAVNFSDIHIESHRRWNKIKPTISILLTAIYFAVSPDEFPASDDEGFFVVPYSDHSSWQELVTFVRSVRPRQVIPIVKDSKKNDFISKALRGREDMSSFSSFLASPLSSPSYPQKVPQKATSQDFPVGNLGLTPLLEVQKTRKKRMNSKRRKALSKGVLYTSFNESKGELSKDIEALDTPQKSLPENEHKCTSATKVPPVNLSQPSPTSCTSRQSLSKNKRTCKDLSATEVVKTNFPKRCPLPRELRAQQPPCGAFVTLRYVPIDEENVCDVCSSHNESALLSSLQNLSETNNSLVKVTSEPTCEKPAAPFLSYSTSDWEDRRDLLNKAIVETKGLVREMRKIPQLGTSDVLRKGFGLCKRLESVKKIF